MPRILRQDGIQYGVYQPCMDFIMERSDDDPTERELECVICLDYPYDAVGCSACRKLFCFVHIHRLSQQRCPHCRNNPLTFVSEHQLQPKIDRKRFEVRLKDRQSRQFKCTIKDCTKEGNYSEMETHRKRRHHELSLQFVIYGEQPREVTNPTSSEQETADFACSGLQPELPVGQQRKLPSRTQAWTMARHASTCRDAKCQGVWTGPWGSFIGGELGQTHFDLTLCERGRRLNELIGWDYSDPKK